MAESGGNNSSGIGYVLLIILMIIIIIIIIALLLFYLRDPYYLIQQRNSGFYLFMNQNIGVSSSLANANQWTIFQPDPNKEILAIFNNVRRQYMSYTGTSAGTAVEPSSSYSDNTAGWVLSGNLAEGYYIQPQGDSTLAILPTATSTTLELTTSVTDDSNVFYALRV